MIIQTATFIPQMRNIAGNMWQKNKRPTMNERAKDEWENQEEPKRQKEGGEEEIEIDMFSFVLLFCSKTR